MAQTITWALSIAAGPCCGPRQWCDRAASAARPPGRASRVQGWRQPPSGPAPRSPGGRILASAHLVGLAALLSLAAGCRAIPEPRAAAPPAGAATASAGQGAHPEVDAARGEFTTTASMLDTWNAVGQILVRLEGVGYEGRAQMLGIYAVRYRGERLLIVTRALVMRSRAQGMRTKVGTALLDGKPTGSAAAVELLGLLQRRLPAALARIEAGGRAGATHRVRGAADLAAAGDNRSRLRQCTPGAADPRQVAAAGAEGSLRPAVRHRP